MAISEAFFSPKSEKFCVSESHWIVFLAPKWQKFCVSESHWIVLLAPKWQKFDKEGNCCQSVVEKAERTYNMLIFQSPISDTVVGRHPPLEFNHFVHDQCEKQQYVLILKENLANL
jgi:hypothetical protein